MPRNHSEKETAGIRAARRYRDVLARYIKACEAIGFNARGNEYYHGANSDARELRRQVERARGRCYNLEPSAIGPQWRSHLEHLNTYLKRYA